MKSIKELRQRVLAAEEQFGLNDAERAAYSERLVVLMGEVEGRISDQKFKIKQQAAVIRTGNSEAAVLQARIDGQGTAIAQQAETIEKLKASGARKANENEQLRTMLQSMLQTIESGGRDGLAEAMQDLDRKVSAMMSAAAAEPEDEEFNELIEAAEDANTDEAAAELETDILEGYYEDEDAAVIEAEEAAFAESDSGNFEEPPAEEIEEPVAEEIEEPVAEVEAEAPIAAEVEAPVAEEIEEPVADVEDEAPIAAEIGAPVSEEIEETVAEEIAEPVAEEIAEPVAEALAEEIEAQVVEIDESVAEALAPQAATESDGQTTGGSLDEIMDRVSKLVEETEAATGEPEPRAPEAPAKAVAEAGAEEIAEEPAQLATGTDS
jgi:hypothetical protein